MQVAFTRINQLLRLGTSHRLDENTALLAGRCRAVGNLRSVRRPNRGIILGNIEAKSIKAAARDVHHVDVVVENHFSFDSDRKVYEGIEQ
jgi:hypothetical protein